MNREYGGPFLEMAGRVWAASACNRAPRPQSRPAKSNPRRTISGRGAGPPPGLPQGAREPRGSEVPLFSQKDDRSPITGAVRSLIQLGRYEILLVIRSEERR